MLFNSLEFGLFLAVAFAVYRLVQRWRMPRAVWLLVVSYLFYASWDVRYLALIVFSTVLDYAVGRGLAGTRRPEARKLLLALSLAGNLGLLGVFKYGNFLLESLEMATGWAMPRVPAELPVGISFYTFQTMSYTIDLYRRRIEPARNLLEFAVYVAFFPQLVAGPIVRARDFLPQLDARPRLDPSAIGEGIFLILSGLVKKMVVADSLRAVWIAPFFTDPGGANALEALVSTWAFYFALYCDFSGYTDVALGAGLLFGFRLPLNFDRPALTTSPLDHWRRWHISLHDWLRDYLFIPLGGSRGSKARTFFNITVTFTAGGVWHGAGWTYALMGLYNGLLGATWRFLRPKPSPRPVTRLFESWLSLTLVALSMVFMWPYTLRECLAVLAAFLRPLAPLSGAITAEGLTWFALAVALHLFPRAWRDAMRAWFADAPAPVVAFAVLVVGAVCSLFAGRADEFFYFQF